MAQTLLLKLSGEALGASDGAPIDRQKLDQVTAEIIAARKEHPENKVALVVGGGNIIRGAQVGASGGDACRGDYMGMLATLINALALQDSFLIQDQACEVIAPYAIPNVAQAYDRRKVLSYLADGVIVIFGGGTGHPFFTTDTTAALRATEIGASELLKGSKVDGIYDADPKKNPNAKRFEQLSFDEVIAGQYAVMDQTAFALCRENKVGIRVFDMTQAGSIQQALGPNASGTIVR